MLEWLTMHEPTVRLVGALSVFSIMASAEVLWPRRPLHAPKGRRWLVNILLVVVNTLLLRVVFPTAAVGLAAAVAERGWGLLNVVSLPVWVGVLVSVLLLDLAIYTQHLVFHRVPWLWRLHAMHHTDPDLDVTSGTRFHPIEILLSMGIKGVIIVALGPPAAAVLLFEIILNLAAMFNHSNVALPVAVDRWVRLVLVTPDMHRIHHSVDPKEHHSNFGFNLPWWDRLFGTYTDAPARGQVAMDIGLRDSPEGAPMRLLWLLRYPFLRGLARA